MDEIFTGIVLGLGVCVPIGPVNILIINYATKSFKNAFALGLGATSADVLYLAFLQFGLLNFIQNDIFLNTLSIFGCLFLTYMAFLMLKSNSKIDKPCKINNESVLKSYIKGITLNLLNPYVILFWLSVAVVLNGFKNPSYVFVGLIGIIVCWVFSLSFFVYRYMSFFSTKVIFFINIISAVILEYFAVMLILKRFVF